MMNDVVSDPVGTFVRLATPSPWHQRPTPLPEGCFKAAFGGTWKVKFFLRNAFSPKLARSIWKALWREKLVTLASSFSARHGLCGHRKVMWLKVFCRIYLEVISITWTSCNQAYAKADFVHWFSSVSPPDPNQMSWPKGAIKGISSPNISPWPKPDVLA